MDGNKDEASKCLKISRDAIESGDRTRAMKFINKACRLDPSLSVDDLRFKLFVDNKTNESSSASSSSSAAAAAPAKPGDNNNNKSDSGARRRVPASGSSPTSSSSSSTTSVAYTEEQISIVREIKKKKDYYDILGVEKSCSVEDIRKAYRKLSLKVHPDKNTAPGAEEAFKAVSKAFQCLGDEENRKKYDLVGSDEQVYERRAARRGGAPQGFNNGFFDGEVDAEEIFRNFFFGGMHPATTAQFGNFSFGPGMGVRTGNNGGGSAGLARTLIQLLPVLLILLLNFLPSSEPIYSISREYSYQHRFTTQKNVNFYVKSGRFEQDYPPNSPERARLEAQVERDYVSALAYRCQHELQRLHWGGARETPYCDSLKRFEAMA